MGTEKCPFCGQEIDAGATKCFFCGAKLDEESIERRLEQLHYQEVLRSARKIRGPVVLEVMVVGILLGIVLFHGVPGGKNPSPLEHRSESSTVRLNAKVTFAGARFVISNNDLFDWENIKLEVVSADFGEPFCLTVTRIPAGGTYTVGAAEFRRNDGTRFNPFSTKSERFWIRCDTPERGNGSYLAGWK
ncbi:MAG TPA: zinc ribbon domain-containing protein [Sedimentisphaerales bacterium]|nr:zinc ribbon domain-containing protein [Sedimentisphaerales bacterium]